MIFLMKIHIHVCTQKRQSSIQSLSTQLMNLIMAGGSVSSLTENKKC